MSNKMSISFDLIPEHSISFAFIKALLFISQVVYNTRGRVVLNIQSLELRARDCIIQYNTVARVVNITCTVTSKIKISSTRRWPELETTIQLLPTMAALY